MCVVSRWPWRPRGRDATWLSRRSYLSRRGLAARSCTTPSATTTSSRYRMPWGQGAVARRQTEQRCHLLAVAATATAATAAASTVTAAATAAVVPSLPRPPLRSTARNDDDCDDDDDDDGQRRRRRRRRQSSSQLSYAGKLLSLACMLHSTEWPLYLCERIGTTHSGTRRVVVRSMISGRVGGAVRRCCVTVVGRPVVSRSNKRHGLPPERPLDLEPQPSLLDLSEW